MCRIQLLNTKQTKPKRIEIRNAGVAPMPYTQIQYYNDCIRAYAVKLNKPVDATFYEIEKNNLLPVIEQAFHNKSKVFVTIHKMQATTK